MMELTELKPCPFCGSTDIGGAGGIVSCYGCSIETRKQTTTDIAITVWNRRANDNVTSPEYISRLRGVMGEVALPAIPTSEMMHAGYVRLQQDDLKGSAIACYECGEVYKAMRRQYIESASPVAGEVKG